MTLDIPGEKVFIQRDVRETPAATATATASSTIVAPIGSIFAWLKSYTNTPATLPTGWVECDGATLSDADSVYNGQVIPDLNGDNRFLRGSNSSGATGGSETHQHITNLANVGNLGLNTIGTILDTPYGITNIALSGEDVSEIKVASTESNSRTGNFQADNTSSTSTLPTYYEIVWIMRIK